MFCFCSQVIGDLFADLVYDKTDLMELELQFAASSVARFTWSHTAYPFTDKRTLVANVA